MAAIDEELYEDLAYEEAEGESDLYDEDLEMDEMDYYDEDEFDDDFDDDFEDEDEDEDEDEFEADDYFDDEFDEVDEFDEYDEYDEFDEDEEEDALDSVMAYALDSEDVDEFLGKLFKRIKKVGKRVVRRVKRGVKRVKRGIGKVGRIAAPILSKIPLPQAQVAARVAKLAGRLRAEGATEEEILEAVAEVATKDRRALPIVAGLTAKTIVRGKGSAMSFGARKKVVKDMKKAAKILVRKRGPKAIRALPKIVKSVKRTTAMKGTPIKAKAMIVKRTAMKVAKSPAMTRKLAKPSAKAKRVTRSLVKSKSYTIPGPARISITAV